MNNLIKNKCIEISVDDVDAGLGMGEIFFVGGEYYSGEV